MREGALKHFGIAFLLAVVFYAVSYWALEAFRPSRGPWIVTFKTGLATPEIVVNQHRLGITNVGLTFTGGRGGTNEPQSVTLLFNEAKPTPFPLPFGTCIFLDTTFLPGTVTMRMFGHEIELLPHVLVIDHREHHWNSGAIVQLPAKTRN